ncbi:putative serine/arginine repetitive matrix protein 5-like [Cocos nucifera]|uniref:Putative serine/arginine repetitive matrix protein 5-like n=1 Tax=Cocos nucifera TaxID=13894 RepID=A0A8K0NB82_COCNU|nr:putative serine/arginine repetitive matrix protein 5-like [Cocos nucifera]
MPRSSRHRSHRSHKHKDERDQSDSDEDGNSRERNPREEEPAASSGVRVSRDLEMERRKSSHSSQGKDLIGSSNGDILGEHGRKRKEREEDVAVSDRWNGGGDDDLVVDKKSKEEEFGPVDLNKSSKSKLSASDSKGRSGRRREGSSGRNEEGGGKVDSVKRRPEKDSSWRESDSQHKETKDRGRERASDRDKKTQDSRHAKSDDVVSRKRSSKTGSAVEEHEAKKDIENSEWQVQHEFQNPDCEKELGKHVRRRRDDSEDKDKWMGDGRESDDRSNRRPSARADHTKNKSYRDERHEEGKYRDKYRVDVDRDQKHRDDKRQDERSWDRIGERSDNKHYRDENMPSESHYKKGKLQDNDLDGSSYVDDHDTKLNRGRKRFSEGYEDHGDLKTRSAKEPHEDADKFFPSRIDSHTEKPRSEHRHSDKVNSSPNNNRPKSSASSSAYAVKDHGSYKSKQADSACRETPSEERIRRSTASTGDCSTAIRDRERVSDSRSSDKFKSKDRIHYMATTAASQHDRNPRSDAYPSPNKLREKSPSASERQYPDRTSARQSFDNEVRQKWCSSRDGDRELPLDGPTLDDQSQTEICNREPTPGGSSSINRTGPFSSSSPNHLLPPPSVRLGIDSPVLVSYEEDNRVQVGDCKSYNRQRRSSDVGLGRGHGNAWRSGPAWPSPIANGFMPLQHGPPPAGFHPAMQQFPGPPLFGVRPSMDLSHTGISYHMHEVSDRFSGRGRPFGWHNPVDGSCTPQLQVWDGSNGVFGDESHIYGRPEWGQNRHIVGGKGWEMNADMWKGQNGNINVDFPVSQKEPELSTHALADEAWVRQPSQHSSSERARTEHLPSEGIDVKQSGDTPSAKNAVESPPNTIQKKIPESSKTPGDNNANLCAKYLSRIDISLDLADPELYKKCMSLLGKLEMTDACDKSKHEHSQNNKEDIRVRRQSANHIFSSLFPTKKDAVFQRAMSLYKKQNGRSKVGFPASAPVCSENMARTNELKDVLDDAGVANGANSVSIMEETKNVAANVDGADLAGIMKEAKNTTTDTGGGANFASSMEEVKDVTTDASGASSASDMEVAKNTVTDADVHPGDAKEQQSNFVSDTVVFVNGSPTCEALKAECRPRESLNGKTCWKEDDPEFFSTIERTWLLHEDGKDIQYKSWHGHFISFKVPPPAI